MFWVKMKGHGKSFLVYDTMHKQDETWFLMWSDSKGWTWFKATQFYPDSDSNMQAFGQHNE